MRTIILSLLCTVSTSTRADPGASATMPLSEAIDLYAAKNGVAPALPPPIGASVDSLRLVARVGADSLDVTAQVRVTVLGADRWVKVPILSHDETVKISSLPVVEGAALAIDGGALVLLSNTKGTYEFEVGFVKQARLAGDRRSARIGVERATLAVLHPRVDASAFVIDRAGLHQDGEELAAYPAGGHIELSWRRAAGAVAAAVVARPPVASLVTAAWGTAVSTLEGKLISRLRYDLQLEGQKTIAFTLPQHHELLDVLVNGASVPFAPADGRLEVRVTPLRSAETAGSVELVMVKTLGSYKLAGSLELVAPQVSWPIHELYLDVYLPDVFTYDWRGGSLAPVAARSMPAFGHTMPTPGRKLSFHQHLITASEPHMTIDYTVDLAEKFYR